VLAGDWPANTAPFELLVSEAVHERPPLGGVSRNEGTASRFECESEYDGLSPGYPYITDSIHRRASK
jgi:hypothetical protein